MEYCLLLFFRFSIWPEEGQEQRKVGNDSASFSVCVNGESKFYYYYYSTPMKMSDFNENLCVLIVIIRNNIRCLMPFVRPSHISQMYGRPIVIIFNEIWNMDFPFWQIFKFFFIFTLFGSLKNICVCHVICKALGMACMAGLSMKIIIIINITRIPFNT